MLRRHPVTSTVAVVYFLVLCVMILGPWADDEATFIGSAIVFFPGGILLVALFGKQRWMVAMSIGVLGVIWLELACIVWRPDAPSVPIDLAAGVVGIAAGVGLAALIGAASGHRAGAPEASFTRFSQTDGSGWGTERQQD